MLIASSLFLSNLIRVVLSDQLSKTCQDLGCEYGCYKSPDNQPACVCPIGLTIDVSDYKSCVKIDTQVVFKNTPVRMDGTIRPLADQTKCFYHKMNGFSHQEKIYISKCYDHSRYQWVFDKESGLIMNSNRIDTEPHCWKIPNVKATKSKQQIFLAPCVEDDENQQWVVINGKVRIKVNTSICAMWNMKDKTRLWAYPCDEMRFSEMVVLK